MNKTGREKRKREDSDNTRRKKRKEEKTNPGTSCSSIRSSVCSSSPQVAIKMNHQHMLRLQSVCARERNLNTQRMGWDSITKHLNELLRIDYPCSVLSEEYFNQYLLSKTYYRLLNTNFNIHSSNVLQWNFIVDTIPEAMAVREAVRNHTLCVEDWLQVFVPCPNFPLANFCRDRVGNMELLLWKPINRRSTRRRSSGNSRCSGGSSPNSQTVNVYKEEPSSSSQGDIFTVVTNRLTRMGMPIKFYFFALHFFGNIDKQFLWNWVINESSDLKVAGFLKVELEHSRPNDVPEFNTWFMEVYGNNV